MISERELVRNQSFFKNLNLVEFHKWHKHKTSTYYVTLHCRILCRNKYVILQLSSLFLDIVIWSNFKWNILTIILIRNNCLKQVQLKTLPLAGSQCSTSVVPIFVDQDSWTHMQVTNQFHRWKKKKKKLWTSRNLVQFGECPIKI